MADQTQSNNPAPASQGPSTTAVPSTGNPLSNFQVSHVLIPASDLQQQIQRLALTFGRGARHPNAGEPLAVAIQNQPSGTTVNPLQYNHPMQPSNPQEVQNNLQFDAPTPTRVRAAGHTIEIVNKQAPAQSQENTRAITKAEAVEKQTLASEKASMYGWAATKQEAAVSAAVPTQSKEQAAPTGTEQSILSTKTPTQALEKALDTILQGASSDPFRTTPERPVSREAQSSQPSSLESSRDSMNHPEKLGAMNVAPLQVAEHAPRDSSLVNQPNTEKGPQTEQPYTAPSQHTIEQRTEQRLDQIRTLQQIVAAEFDTPTIARQQNLTDSLRTAIDSTPSIHPRHESTTVSIQTLRDGLLSKFEAIQSQIQTSSTERQSLEQNRYEPTASVVQGRNDFLKATPIHHDAAQITNTQLADRSGQRSPISKLLGDTPSLSTLVAPGASILYSNISQQERPIPGPLNTDALERLTGLLKKFSKRSTNFELMKRMDSTLEQTCLSLVTVVALGVVGIEVMMRLAHAALAALLKELRDTQQKESAQSQADEQLQAELEAELDTYLSDIVEKDDIINSVVDVSGIIISSETGEPLPGILIGSRELGSTVSDGDGSFVFRNIPYGVSYSLNMYKGAFQVSPTTVKGVSGEASMHRIEVTLTPIQRR